MPVAATSARRSAEHWLATMPASTFGEIGGNGGGRGGGDVAEGCPCGSSSKTGTATALIASEVAASWLPAASSGGHSMDSNSCQAAKSTGSPHLPLLAMRRWSWRIGGHHSPSPASPSPLPSPPDHARAPSAGQRKQCAGWPS